MAKKTSRKKARSPKKAKKVKKAKTAKKAKKAKKKIKKKIAKSKAIKAGKKTPRRVGTTKKKRPSKSQKASGRVAVRTHHVDFLTYKVDQVRKFYEEKLGLRAETRDHEGLNYLVVKTTSSSSLGFMPPHPEMTAPQPSPREPTIYLLVDDVDRVYAELLARGVALIGEPQDMPWGDRVVTTTDPEGRTVMLGQRLQPSKRS